MKPKHLVALLLVAIALVAAFFAMHRNDMDSMRKSQEKIGTPVLPGLDLEKLDTLKISSGDELKVEIARRGDIWTVANLHDYPVDPSKLRSFTLDLSNMKTMKEINSPDSQLARFGLDRKDSSNPPFKVELASSSAKIAELTAGKKNTKKGSPEFGGDVSEGRFLMIPEKKTVLVSDKTLYELENEASDWIDKTFLSAGKLKSASLSEDGKTVWTAARTAENEDMKLQNVPEGREADSSKISEISSALSYMSFARIADPKTADDVSGLDKPKIFTAEDYEGIRYIVKIGKKDNSDSYAKVSAEFAGISQPPAPKDEKPEDKEKREKSFQEKEKKARDKTDEINKKYSPWLYLLAEHKVKILSSTLEDLLKKPEEKKDEKKPGQKNEQESK